MVKNLVRKRKRPIAETKGDRAFHFFNYAFMLFLAFIIIYPLWFIVIASVSSPDAVLNGEVWLLPDVVDFGGYQRIFDEPKIWTGYRNTILYTTVGTSLNILLTIPAGYAISRPTLPYRKTIMWFFIVTLFFNGGLVPFYLLVSELELINTFWALILPRAVSVWNVFLTKAYYESNISTELIEAAEIDGASQFRTFMQVILPLSKPIVAVMILFYAVGHWNAYFDALIFIRSENLYPLQLVLRDILVVGDMQTGGIGDAQAIYERLRLANQIKYGVIIVSSLPIILFYPFVQKFFKQGFLVGSFK
ncbi:MAG: carbohydrate ABC transporter permease [Acholeplasmataceae bacterium]